MQESTSLRTHSLGLSECYGFLPTKKITTHVFFQYPAEILNLEYKPNFAVRGLHYDIEKGLLLKLDSFLQIQFGAVYRGLTPVSTDEVLKLYRNRIIPIAYVEGDTRAHKVREFIILTLLLWQIVYLIWMIMRIVYRCGLFEINVITITILVFIYVIIYNISILLSSSFIAQVFCISTDRSVQITSNCSNNVDEIHRTSRK